MHCKQESNKNEHLPLTELIIGTTGINTTWNKNIYFIITLLGIVAHFMGYNRQFGRLKCILAC